MFSLSEYALRMTCLSARLFGEIARPTDSKSMKETYDWYPNHNTYFALIGDTDFKDEQLRLKKLRGKGKPRKGEGKRATKKK
ncbi:unnamed protein product [Nyctereutes procyonoides]|uniref:Small ribosomal subunit protein mS33 n=1 Tax=Nyctereutes procyonoides TaxID=34880 RepID=A0A811Z819_NYCPR|nr:unnamed protein product [Nyctereutes procyonoides]